MNEQLIVKNFGPIKDATVDFKRVTVFIGPTGGGKSTLAKLAAIFRDDDWLRETKHLDRYAKLNRELQKFQIFSYLKKNGQVEWDSQDDSLFFNPGGFHHSSTERKKTLQRGLIFSMVLLTR
ncbi:MAG: AAA family ATPase [Hymenobacter sp.]